MALACLEIRLRDRNDNESNPKRTIKTITPVIKKVFKISFAFW
jgi:hypothetical protein